MYFCNAREYVWVDYIIACSSVDAGSVVQGANLLVWTSHVDEQIRTCETTRRRAFFRKTSVHVTVAHSETLQYTYYICTPYCKKRSGEKTGCWKTQVRLTKAGPSTNIFPQLRPRIYWLRNPDPQMMVAKHRNWQTWRILALPANMNKNRVPDELGHCRDFRREPSDSPASMLRVWKLLDGLR